MFKEEIKKYESELIEIYKDFHRHPEPGFTEKRTSKKVAEYLKSYGLEVIENIALTGVIGILDSGKPGKTIMLRADMDCLRVEEQTGCDYKSEVPGCMHACGHDTHMTMLLGAAKVLAQNKDKFSGKIKFFFEPAEEQIDPTVLEEVRKYYKGEGGSGFLIQEGAMKDVDACIMMHNQPSLPIGTVQIARKNACASSDVFDITIVGKGGHGARPHEAVDPVPAMCEAIEAIHLIPSREVSCLETVVMSVGDISTPGSVWNAVADKARFVGGFRTFNQSVREMIFNRVQEISNEIAKAHKCTTDIKMLHGYMPCINNTEIAEFAAESCAEVLGKENVDLTDVPAMTSESAGQYLDVCPGAFLWIGSGDPKHPLHNPYMLPDLRVLTLGAEVNATNAINLLKKLNK